MDSTVFYRSYAFSNVFGDLPFRGSKIVRSAFGDIKIFIKKVKKY